MSGSLLVVGTILVFLGEDEGCKIYKNVQIWSHPDLPRKTSPVEPGIFLFSNDIFPVLLSNFVDGQSRERPCGFRKGL